VEETAAETLSGYPYSLLRTSVPDVTELESNRGAPPGDTGLRRVWIAVGLWLLYLTPAAWATFQSTRPLPIKLIGYVLVAAFAVLFAHAFIGVWRERFGTTPLRPAVRYGAFAVLAVLAAAIIWIAGQVGMVSLLYLAQASILLLSGWLMWSTFALVVLVGMLLAELVPEWTSSVWLAVAVPAAALVLWALMRAFEQNRRLESANAEIARLAVERERLRMSRDLHDILGHSLTTVAVKAELARKMIDRDGERAALEMTDVERLAREALRDIRATVAGHRTITLAFELAVARSVLDAAGIAAEVPSAVDSVRGTWSTLFGWVVREGVTNVVRHSGARHCWISVSPTAIEVRDDGYGPASTDHHSGGLQGLRERAEAAGATMSAGRRPGGDGWRLRVEVPE
jgi:two-component system, NarL family, sensor histidine kinase DesK